MDAVGNFVVAFDNAGSIAAQRFNLAGTKNGAELTVAAGTLPTAAMDADGDFAIGYQSGGDVYFQRYSRAAAKINGPVVASTYGSSPYLTGTQANLAAAMDGDGDLVMAFDGAGYALNSTTPVADEVHHVRYGFKAPVGAEVNAVSYSGGESSGVVLLSNYFTLGGTEAVNNYKIGKITNKRIVSGTPTVTTDANGQKKIDVTFVPGENGSAEIPVRIADGSEGSLASLSNNNFSTIIVRRLQSPDAPVLAFVRDRTLAEGRR